MNRLTDHRSFDAHGRAVLKRVGRFMVVLFSAPTVVLTHLELTEKFLLKAPVLLKTLVDLILLQRAAQIISAKSKNVEIAG